MKMVMAIVKPFKLDDIKDALMKAGVEGMTITEVQGYGRQKGQTDISGGTESATSFLPKLKLEIAIPEKLEKKVVEIITDAANTGRIGDGKIFVYNLENVVRIRTGEINEAAI